VRIIWLPQAGVDVPRVVVEQALVEFPVATESGKRTIWTMTGYTALTTRAATEQEVEQWRWGIENG
jgi:hypothetical protein